MNVRAIIQSAFRAVGFELRRIQPPGSRYRPIGNIDCFLEDVRARGFKPRGIIDVGANIGGWTRMALSLFPGTPAILVEPQEEMEAPLRRLCQEVPTCHYVKAGAAREPGVMLQTIAADLAGSTFLPPADSTKIDAGQQRETRMVTLDGLLEGEFKGFHPDLVKLDIQGFELEALRGGTLLFGATELFVVETSLFHFDQLMPITREMITFMAEKGYEIYDITEFMRRPSDGALGQVDLAFAKADGILRSHSRW